MPFFLPALGALFSDIAIVYLIYSSPPNANPLVPEQGQSDDEHVYIYRISYIAPLAIIRLVLLMFPLPYHNYAGTAVKCPLVYEIFYGGTLVVVLIQLLGIMILDPESLSSLMPEIRTRFLAQTSSDAAVAAATVDLQGSGHGHTNMPQTWLVLWLNLISDLLHIILLWHVRSTAPADWSDRKHVLYFYTQHTNGLQQQQQQSYPSLDTNGNGLNGSGGGGSRNHLMLDQPHRAHRTTSGPRDLLERMRCVPEGYDDIMSRMQQRFQATKNQWTQRLEDFTIRMNLSSHGPTTTSTTLTLLPLTPFRVLLQLFAYESDVLPQLDLVFEKDDGVALTFYVPQLLSFLLHGAYHNAPDLERWILGKCKENIFFAHQCFWFLRAWCLEGSHAEQKGLQQQHQQQQHQHPPLNVTSRNSSFSSLLGGESGASLTPNHKYPPEERSAMEALLKRVVQCGQMPAQNLYEFAEGIFPTGGPLMATDEEGFVSLDTSPSAVITAIDAGFLPMNPESTCPSVNHLDSVYAQDKVGLLPANRPVPENVFMQAPNFLDTLLNLTDSLFAIPRENRTQELRRQLQCLEVEFLPSNTIYVPVTKTHHRTWRIVADESIAISTKERVPCIVTLEVIDYSSPSPRPRGFSATGILDLIQRQHSHDSHDAPASPGGKSLFGGSVTLDEREVVHLWRTSRRHPRRFETLLDKVTTFTRDTARSAQETLNKLQKLQQQPQETLSWVGGRNNGLSDGGFDEETANLTSGDVLSTPIKSKCSMDPVAAMGQWSSPLATHSPSKSRGPYIRTSSGRLALMRNERVAANGGTTIVKEEQVMGALLDIRTSMESRQDLEGSFTVSDSTGTYGTTQRQRSRPPPVVFKESWSAKESRLRSKSVYGSHPNWRLLPILLKSNDDLRQEQLAAQLIYRMASILAQEKVPVWLCPYEIVALTDRGGIIEAIPDTISLDSLKRNDPNFVSLSQFFGDHFEGDDLSDAKANFVESLAAYSVVSFLLQIKDRHNGNILLDNRGHLIHIDFGFFFLSSPGKNSGFESAPFKLTADFVDLMGGPHSNTFRMFRELCCRTFLTLRKHCFEITLLVEMIMVGNEDLNCFRGRPEDAVRGLRERFRLELNDRACTEYVNGLVDESLENWRTRWYDRYQRFCVGVL